MVPLEFSPTVTVSELVALHPLRKMPHSTSTQANLKTVRTRNRDSPRLRCLVALVCPSLSLDPTKGGDVKDNNVRIFFAELIGTMVLVLGGCGTAVLATGGFPLKDAPGGLSVGILGVAIAFGLTLLVMAYAIGPISGCHINPAVTLGMVIAKKTTVVMLPVYWVAQIVGGIIGALFIKIIASGVTDWKMGNKAGAFATNGYGIHSPGRFSLAAVGVTEVVLTMLLVLVVIHTTRKDFAIGFGGIAVGLTLTLVHLISIPVDNTSVNPARSFAVAIFKGGFALDQIWAFIVFPLIGAIIAALIAIFVFNEPKKVASSAATS